MVILPDRPTGGLSTVTTGDQTVRRRRLWLRRVAHVTRVVSYRPIDFHRKLRYSRRSWNALANPMLGILL